MDLAMIAWQLIDVATCEPCDRPSLSVALGRYVGDEVVRPATRPMITSGGSGIST